MGVTGPMVATDISEDAEASPEGGPPQTRKRRSPVVTFAIGATVELVVCAAVVSGAQLLAAPVHPDTGFSLKLEPHRVADTPHHTAAAAPHFSVVEVRSPGGNLVADPALVEDSPLGPLPVIAPDGRAPMTAYARTFDAKDKRPKIAIVIGGLNVSANNTKLALQQLPPAITLAVVPFGSDAQSAVDQARETGHEVLLEVPMEPFDFPESDPGANALMVAASGTENIRRFDWSLSRVTGYVGITNLLGGRFMSEAASLEPIMLETARRGLMFVDDGASKSSIAMTTARHAETAIATGTLILDDVQSRDAIDKKLADLEAEARRTGFAIGTGSAFPVTIARLASWAEGVEARGFQLVPITASAAKPAPQKTAAKAPPPKQANAEHH